MDNLSPQRLNHLFNHLPQGCILFDREGKVFYANHFFAQMSGYEVSELMDYGYYDQLFRSKEGNQRMREKALAAFDTFYDDLELVGTRKTGDKFNLLISGSCVKEEDSDFGVLLIQDITTKKAYEQIFETNYNNFAQVTNQLDNAMNTIKEQNKTLEEYKAKMTRELDIAKNVQKAIIPTDFSDIQGFDMYGVSIPSDELGGDYFDYFPLSSGYQVGILIADVSGHGVPSSLITTMVKAYFEYYTKRSDQPDEVLKYVNRDMASIIMDTGFYLTAFYCVLNTRTLELTVSIAGHDTAICVTRGKKAIRLGEGAEGTILGIFPDAEFKSVTYQLEPDSKIIIYTDGITEARSETGEFYGPERLEAFLTKQLGRSSKESVEDLIAEVNQFYGSVHANDDRTLVIFDIHPGTQIQTGTGESQSENLETVPSGLQSSGHSDVEIKELWRQGKKCFLDRDFDGALTTLETLISQGTDDPEVYLLAGQAAGNLGKFDQGIGYLQKAADLDPASVKAYYFMGFLQVNSRDIPGARASWQKVLDLDPDYRDTRQRLEKLPKKS